MGVGAWVSPGDPPGSGTVSLPSRQAGGSVTAGLFFCECDHRHGPAPWPGPHRGLGGRVEAPHARGARAGPSAGGYGSASLLSSPRPATHPAGTREANPGEPTFQGPFTGRPGRRWGLSARDDMSRRLRWASPKGAHAGWNLLRRAAGTKVPPDGGAVLAEQAQVACAGYGLGAVGRASLPKTWLTCFLTVSTLMNSSPARAWFGVPAASIASTCSSRPVSGSIRPAPPGQHFAPSPAR